MAQSELIYGIHPIHAVLTNEPERLLEIMVAKGRNDDRINEVINLARKQGVAVQFVHRKTLDEKTQNSQHQGILAKVKPAKALNEDFLTNLLSEKAGTDKPLLLLLLDSVTDPHNLGACLRNADAAGADAIIAPKDKAVGITPVVSKVAVGAAQTVPLVQVTNLARTIRLLQDEGVWVVGTAGEADQLIYDCDLTGPVALVMGAEGKGMRRLTRESCDELVKLPMSGTVSSLNVSVASGICLFEVVRQRR